MANPAEPHPVPAQARFRTKVALLRKSPGILTWSEDLQEGFQQLDVDTRLISFRPESISERVIQWRTNKRLIHNPATIARVSDALGAFAPDLVIVLNYPGLPAAFLRSIRAAIPTGTPVVGWLCDRIESFPNDCEAAFDGVYYFDSSCQPILENAYGCSGATLDFLPLAASPSRYTNQEIPVSNRIPRMVFAGNCTPERHSVFAACRNLGVPLDLFGPHAGNFPKFWRNRKFPPSALARFYQHYAVNLNLLQPGNTSHGLNMRAFEIPCTGGLATYPMVPDLPRCFCPESEILCYRSLRELADLTRHAIHHPDHATAISRAGHARVMREHTFRHRAQRFIDDWLPPLNPA